MTTYAQASSVQARRSVRYTMDGVACGVREGVPLALSVAPWGVAYGVAAQAIVPMDQGLAMSAYVYSATAQFAALGMWSQPIAIPSLLVAVFAINARYLLQGLTLAPWLAPLPPWRRWGTLFFLSDAGWAASLKRFEQGDADVGHLLGVCLAIYVAWILSSGLGMAAPLGRLDAATWGLDFAVSAAIIGLAGARWSGRSEIAPWCVAAAVALVMERLLGGSSFMIVGGVLGALAGACRDARSSVGS